MRALLTILIVTIFSQSLHSQEINDNLEIRKTEKYLRDKGVKLRYIKSHDGYSVHYNCDSIPFLKKIVGDTIKICTEIGNFAMDVSNIDNYISKENFGKTVYVKDIFSDGRISVSGMHETVFISRHDSLFEIESGYEKEGPKLIFHPKMFVNGKTKVKLNKRYNYLQDQIVLERTWIRDGVQCYTIRINNKEGGYNTSYSYTFDQKMRFVDWEDCKSRTK